MCSCSRVWSALVSLPHVTGHLPESVVRDGIAECRPYKRPRPHQNHESNAESTLQENVTSHMTGSQMNVRISITPKGATAH